MNIKMKQSGSSEITQPERTKRFIRRNSFHVLHCRSGSLNKLDIDTELFNGNEVQTDKASGKQEKGKRDPVEVDTSTIMKQFGETGRISQRRGSRSMKMEGCCHDRISLSDKYEQLRSEYNLQRNDLQVLQNKCQRLSDDWNEERWKCQNFQEEIQGNKKKMKKMQQKVQKYRCEYEQMLQEREIMIKKIGRLQLINFNQQTKMMQSYREMVLEVEINKLKQILQKSKSEREKQLLCEVEQLREQKYNLEMLNARIQMSNNLLMKQLKQTKQEILQTKANVHKAVTQSVEFINLANRYRSTLAEMGELRSQILLLERSESSILSNMVLTESQSSMFVQQQQ